jgi:hypothetical protein
MGSVPEGGGLLTMEAESVSIGTAIRRWLFAHDRLREPRRPTTSSDRGLAAATTPYRPQMLGISPVRRYVRVPHRVLGQRVAVCARWGPCPRLFREVREGGRLLTMGARDKGGRLLTIEPKVALCSRKGGSLLTMVEMRSLRGRCRPVPGGHSRGVLPRAPALPTSPPRRRD